MRRHPVVVGVGGVRVLAVLIRPVVPVRTGHRRGVCLLRLLDRVSTGRCGVLLSVVVAVVVGLRVSRIVVVIVITRVLVVVVRQFVGVVLRVFFPCGHDSPAERDADKTCQFRTPIAFRKRSKSLTHFRLQ